MVGPLVDNAESWLHRVTLIKQGHYLHDVRVANAYSCSMRQRDNVLVVFSLAHEWNHFEDVVVEHKNDKRARLS